MTQALVIGAGPAGLMAAEELARAGIKVIVAEAKPSVGRKFLMAGKSGLNLTKDEPRDRLIAAFGNASDALTPMLSECDARAVQGWATGLGQEIFTGSTGRVFPKAMKASPLLRAWLQRLDSLGVEIRTRWRLLDWKDGGFQFDTPDGQIKLSPRIVVLALGGASWARLGSDGAWAKMFQERGLGVVPFEAANVGLRLEWSAHMQKQFGAPLKGVALMAGDLTSRGECVISAAGLEGGGIYTMTPAIRAGHDLFIDLLPDWTLDRVAAKIAGLKGKKTVSNQLRAALGLDPAKLALLMEFGRPLSGGEALARLIKAIPIRGATIGDMDHAISTAGGVAWSAVDETLMLRDAPGVFVAGEMLNWEAPTGGYLITGCLATGKWAGRHAAQWAASKG
ncbi:MAG: TIGR03862 family flavoprotein [Marinosulfonomonas sp.]